ncbi:hypothetical protein A6R68_01276 [Neotoma lepida]|uniref:Thymosin beta n=1 Tax=Neotoma lepida TaxID=56216 RepID=A0A1A6GV17_NEOLE|nr:hypothetical protein A6R68_01276 [Neotoma lepida]
MREITRFDKAKLKKSKMQEKNLPAKETIGQEKSAKVLENETNFSPPHGFHTIMGRAQIQQ